MANCSVTVSSCAISRRSCSATRSACASSSSGSGPVGAAATSSRWLALSPAIRTVALTRSASAESRNQVCWASSACGNSSPRAVSCSASSAVATSSLSVISACSLRSAVSASLVPSKSARRETRSSAARRRRASRRSACTVAARRATSAWRPRGLSWRRSSVVRSVNRAKLAAIDSSLRTAFSLRLRCLSTPAASSTKARRSSGRDSRICESRPWPTITCISRPMPESDNSSCTSISRQVWPLISYSPAPSRNMRRVIDTSEYSIGSAWSELSIVSVTSARPSGARLEVPAKMTSSILPPRSALAPCSPITQVRASTTLDLPEPLGPTTQVMPGSKRRVVGEAKDLKPFSVRLLRCTAGQNTGLGAIAR
ncbi:Uncharacterised protein [Mycobacteroides abscessus]|nr:Uncharacterised protein [Mycobacteroides abscessus]SHT29482.1 Uncharacterised protein [Mycobacteroides abscessus subsp. abscessus]SHW24403.1 Uncharacterised protein [Mycobacteroides abscessus subsp. abscessus]SIB66275.1 Uncharacterised protein [Mycobacteroides abscessus subsp. abscessus]SID65268.1 Uncharacterised protein [Mycobacteroides abscessus subsp. abscessus]